MKMIKISYKTNHQLLNKKDVKYTTTSTSQDSIAVNKIIEECESKRLKGFPKKDQKALIKSSSYLDKIHDILKRGITEHEKQKLIETEWIEVAKNSISMSEEIYKKQTPALLESFDYLKGLFKRKGRKPLSPYEAELCQFENVIIAFSILISSYKNKNTQTNTTMKIADSILKRMWYKNKAQNGDISFEEFLAKKNITTKIKLNIGETFGELFWSSISPHQIFVSFLDPEINQYVIQANKVYEDEILKNVVIKPHSLPMVCTPLQWSEDSFGGFLENKNTHTDIVTGSQYHNHTITRNSKLYDSINYVNSQRFEVNKELLDYILNEGRYLLDEVEEKDRDNFLKTIISLNVASTYRDVPIYLNTNIDWRSRIYTNSFYLSYQGSDVSLALINLNKGQVLTHSGLMNLYICGANSHNENNISKESFQKRIDWVLNNIEKIKRMDPSFICKAENPFMFSAFALTIKKLSLNPNAEVKTPVFLDATCSGIQHFAAMLLDNDLGVDVNLTQTAEVKDLYTKLVKPINDEIKKFGMENLEFEKFKNIKLSRKELKRIIMTKTYNVTLYGIADHIKNMGEKIEIKKEHPSIKNKEIITYTYMLPGRKKDELVELTSSEVFKLAQIINKNIFNSYPTLNKIYIYLTSLASILLRFSIPITWATPSGLIITQHYLQSTTKKVSMTILGKNKTIVLREWVENSMDNKKQVNAVIPNIIHSFDASHLLEVIAAISLKNIYILPIHDCYGTHPNDMDSLAVEVRKQFIKIYSQTNFLETLREKVIVELKTHSMEVIEEDGEIYVTQHVNRQKIDKILIPKAPQMGTLSLNEIMKSKYMIS